MSAFNRVEDIVRNCDTAYLDEHYTRDTGPGHIAAKVLAEHRAEVLAEAAEFVGNDDDCECGGCDSCVPRRLAAGLLRLIGEESAATATAPAPAARFEEPTPPAPHGAAARQAFADQLRTRPDTWALLGTYDNARTARTSAYHIRAAANPQNQPFAPAGTFEAEARSLCGESRVYVRFAGGESQ
jgi:hypothetical protein